VQLRRQIEVVCQIAIGDYGPRRVVRGQVVGPRQTSDIWVRVHNQMAFASADFAERVPSMLVGPTDDPQRYCVKFLLSAGTDSALDIIELIFREIDTTVREQLGSASDIPDEAIKMLNRLFQDHRVGYQFSGGRLIRVDSLFLHEQAVEPALTLLHSEGFEGPIREFMDAHAHFRHRRYPDANHNALKAFESTMKAICKDRAWPYDPNDNAKKLLDILMENGLIPAPLRSHLTGLRTTLESGLPTVRNNMGGHGQGPEVVDIPEHIAAYALHLAATNIVLLVEAHRATPR